MYDANVPEILERIGPDDIVLDIGGWARCFNRANYVIDSGPYETHGSWYREIFRLGPQGGDVEYFDADRWIQRDVCDRDPLPFGDKSIDFCVCSHTLEDIRDPVWVCREMNRVAKRGYIEVPSPSFELTRDREPGVPVGLSHHRWVVDIRDGRIVFLPKHHYIHGDPRYSVPREIGMSAPDERQIGWLFWEGELQASEHYWSKEEVAEMVVSIWMREAGESREEVLRRIEEYAESKKREGEALARLDELERQLAEALRQGDELRAHLDQYSDIGPTAIDMTRRLRRISRRHPRLSSLIKQVIRAA